MILDYPKFTTEELVQRAVKHRKPFAAEGDKGIKDYLIWKTVLALAEGSKAPIKLVSKNTNDFSDGQGGMHPDLLADLDAARISHDRVVFGETLDQVLLAFIAPALQEVKTIEEELRDGIFEGLNLEAWLDANLAERIDLEAVDDIRRALRSAFENPTVDGISDIENLNVLAVRRLPSGEILIELEVDVLAHIGVFIFQADYYALEDEISASEWNDHYMHGTTYVGMHVNLLLTFDLDREEVTSCEVTSASASYSDDD